MVCCHVSTLSIQSLAVLLSQWHKLAEALYALLTMMLVILLVLLPCEARLPIASSLCCTVLYCTVLLLMVSSSQHLPVTPCLGAATDTTSSP